MTLKHDMPVLARHEGSWEGEYIHVDADGREIDRHACRLEHYFPEDGPYPYYQINTYRWADGREEVTRYDARYAEGKIWFEHPRITGYAWEVDPRTVILTWSYNHAPEQYLYEIIHISDDGMHRTRTWHWYNGGEVFKRTLIKERRVG